MVAEDLLKPPGQQQETNILICVHRYSNFTLKSVMKEATSIHHLPKFHFLIFRWSHYDINPKGSTCIGARRQLELISNYSVESILQVIDNLYKRQTFQPEHLVRARYAKDLVLHLQITLKRIIVGTLVLNTKIRQ